jgi:RND family efflux transporter MFP subunit
MDQLFAAEPAPVYVVEAKIGPLIETLPLTGTVTSERTAALSPRVSGLVLKVNVDAGDRVSAGDVLIELDPTLAKLDLNRAEAALSEAKAALNEAKRLRDEALDLSKSKNIPQTTLQARISDVEIKAAVVSRLEAEYRQQLEIVNRHTVPAPFDAVVSRKLTEAGEWVNTGTPVVDLVATDALRLDVQAPQEYFHLIDKDTAVSVKLDAVPDTEFPGRVATTVPVNDPGARTFLTRIVLDDANNFIIPGMSARAIFRIHLKQEALQLPRDAIIQYPDGRNTVWIIRKVDGRLIASEQQVQLGRRLASNVTVRTGLNAGSIVVVRGNETLQEGQAVQILEQTTADTN